MPLKSDISVVQYYKLANGESAPGPNSGLSLRDTVVIPLSGGRSQVIYIYDYAPPPAPSGAITFDRTDITFDQSDITWDQTLEAA